MRMNGHFFYSWVALTVLLAPTYTSFSQIRCDSPDLICCMPTRDRTMVNICAPLQQELEPLELWEDEDNVKAVQQPTGVSETSKSLMQLRCTIRKITENISENISPEGATQDYQNTIGTGFTTIFTIPSLRAPNFERAITNNLYSLSKGLSDAIQCKNEAEEAARAEDQRCQQVYTQYARDPLGDAKERCVLENLDNGNSATKCDAVSYCQGETPSDRKVLGNIIALIGDIAAAVGSAQAAMAVQGKIPIDISSIT